LLRAHDPLQAGPAAKTWSKPRLILPLGTRPSPDTPGAARIATRTVPSQQITH